MAKNQTSNSSYESVLKQVSTEKVSFFSFSKIYPAYITLIITLSVSLGLWQLVSSQFENETRTNFDKTVTSIMTRFESEYVKHNQVLTSVRGLYDNLVEVVKDYFDLYASIPTKTLESLSSVIYLASVPNDNYGNYVLRVRAQGLYYYDIIPEGSRDIYYPIQFIVPYEKNQHLSGYDLGTINTFKKELIFARDNNKLTATPVFNLKKDTSEFFLISPVYSKGVNLNNEKNRKKYFEGAVILEINSDKFFNTSLGTGNQADTSVIFQVYNVNSTNEKDIIFQSKNANLLKQDYSPDLEDERIFKIADKEIKVKFYTIPNYGGSIRKYAPILTLGVSLLLSFLAFAFIVNVINRKQSALNLAERMTRSQRRIVESSNDIIAVLDLNGYWKSMNPASKKILNYEPDELVNHKIDDLFISDNEKEQFYKIIDEPSEDLTRKIDVLLKSKDGEEKWISFSLSVSRIEGLVYITGRDVTLEKIAEEQEKIRNKQILLAEQLSREANEFKSSFFAKLSLQLRNSLTGILGYLELLSFKAYESEEELDNYIKEAEKSSREILNFIMETSDSWGVSEADKTKTSETDSIRVMTAIKLEKPILNAIENFNSSKPKPFDFKIDETIKNDIAVIDNIHFSKTLTTLFELFAYEIQNPKFMLYSSVTKNDEITNLIIEINGANDLSKQMIDLFNKNIDHLLEILPKDKNDIILNLAIASSNFRMVNGKMNIKYDGDKIIINIALQKQIQQQEEII